jgi:hypothetical protein
MRQYTRIVQRSKKRDVRNPISGHQWTEETLIERYDVIGPFGRIGSHKHYDRAEKEANDWNAYYNKYPPVGLEPPDYFTTKEPLP